jgi:DNA-directed RNA polymerase specialized sigma24 family protein
VAPGAQPAPRAWTGSAGNRDSRVLTWIHRVTTNVAIDRLRSAQRRGDLERADDDTDGLETALSANATHERSVESDATAPT